MKNSFYLTEKIPFSFLDQYTGLLISSGFRGGGGVGTKGAMAPLSSVPDKDYLLCTLLALFSKKAPWPLDLEAPVYNLRAKQWILGPLLYIFQKKFPASLRSAWILFFFPILLVSFCSLFHSYFIFLCAYFYIILTQAITFLACKDWSQVFLHTLLHKKCLRINKYFYIKLFWNFNKKCSG